MSHLVGYFAGKGHLEVHLILYGIERDVFYHVPEDVIIHRPCFEFSNNLRLWCTFKTILFLRGKIKVIMPDSVLSFGEFWNNLVLISLYGTDIPVFVSDRAQPDLNLGKFHEILRHWLYPKAKGYIAQTLKAKQIALARKRNVNIRVIGNPIRDIKPGLPEEKENIVLTVGRLVRTKHLDQLIRLFVRIGKPDWKLMIVGGDAQKHNLMEELQQLVRELDAADRVILAGTQSDVDRYYRRSRIFAFTSSSEGFPNVVGEAMSAGLPVVSFDCVAGPSEMIRDGENGFLVPVFDYETFEKRLRLLMDDPDLREKLGGNAQRSIAKFSIESIGQQFYSFILNP